MRIRSTKPEFWRSERIASVSWDARLVLKALESYVDDNGVGKDDLALIVGDLFQRDMIRDGAATAARVVAAMDELTVAGLLWRYTAVGKRLLCVAFWESVQRVEKPQKGRLPRPDGTMNYRESDIGEAPGAAHSGNVPGTLPEVSGGLRKSAEAATNRFRAPENAPDAPENASDAQGSCAAETPDASAAQVGVPGTLRSVPEVLPPGTGEQGNRGTGKSLAHQPMREPDALIPAPVVALDAPKRKPAKRPKTGTGYSAEFERFWAVYPNTRDKHAASLKFAIAQRTASAEVLIAAAQAYADEVRGKDSEHIKYGKTWLHQRCWENHEPGAGARPAPTPDGAAEWVRQQWQSGQVAAIEERTCLRYRRPDPPDDVTGRADLEAWALAHAREWIATHHQTIVDQLTAKAAS